MKLFKTTDMNTMKDCSTAFQWAFIPMGFRSSRPKSSAIAELLVGPVVFKQKLLLCRKMFS